jgi:hypothetical protein
LNLPENEEDVDGYDYYYSKVMKTNDIVWESHSDPFQMTQE